MDSSQLNRLHEAHEMGIIDVMAEAQKRRPPYAHRCAQCGELVSVLHKEKSNGTSQ